MNDRDEKILNCSAFEEHLTDYLDKALDSETHKACAAHALRCPLCHGLLNEIKDALDVCREMSTPKMPMTRLEARILNMTMPQTAMSCEEFENYLTDYLDGFLPAKVFHRWERHAVLCEACTDLPGEVVRSIAACYTYKLDELPVPAALHAKILQSTLGTVEAKAVRATRASELLEWVRSLRFPIPIPQLAPVAMMLIFAFFIFSQTVSADGSLTDVYQKSYQLAEQTYQQGAEVWEGSKAENDEKKDPVTGTTLVTQEEKK
jgi:anti-sigma factor RsiW